MTVPIVQAWCPGCQEMAMPDERGRCVWCDTPTGAGAETPPARQTTLPLLLRATAATILPRTRYRSASSCANSLHDHFKRRGWQLRDRAAATADSNRRRARPRPAPRICAGVRLNAPGKGQPCRARAMAGSDFCVAHDPGRQAGHAEHLARVRPARAAPPLSAAA